MSQIQNSRTIKQEVDIINTAIGNMATKKGNLVGFILSVAFLEITIENFRKFNQLMHEWVSSLIILLKDVETPIVGEAARLPTQPLSLATPQNMNMPSVPGSSESLSKLESIHLSLAQAIVLIIADFGVAFATILLKQPIIILVCVVACSFALAFISQIAEIIKRFLTRTETKETTQDLRHLISKSVAVMRNDYTQRRFLIMAQKNPPPTQLSNPSVNKALYDLKTQSEETLAQRFLSTIDWIDTECNDAAFKRKQFLLSLLKQAPQPMPVFASER